MAKVRGEIRNVESVSMIAERAPEPEQVAATRVWSV
jgi:hypothetical protein